MKTLTKKNFRILGLAMIMVCSAIGFCFAADFSSVAAPVISLLNSLLTPLMLIVGAAGSLYCILLGVKYARAEEPQDREKAKQHLKSAVIGFILIFVLIVVLNLLMPTMMAWVNESTNSVAFNGVQTTAPQTQTAPAQQQAPAQSTPQSAPPTQAGGAAPELPTVS